MSSEDDGLTPEQEAGLDLVVDIIISYVKTANTMAERLKKVPFPSRPVWPILAKKILDREDCPDTIRWPPSVLAEYLHRNFDVFADAADTVEKLR